MSSQLPFGLTLLLLLAGAARAEVQIWVEPRLADELDPITLTLRATDADIGDEPDLSVLQDDFEVLNQQRISRSQIINGRSSSWVEFQFTLHPKRAGELIIPPIPVGAEQSPETRVIVRALDARVKQTIERMVFFETELSVNPVYVQAQTVFVRRLYYASGVQLYSDLPSTPAVADAVIVPLGDPRSFTTVRSGTRYGVIEQRYAIFPEAPGVLTIPDAAITSSVRIQQGGRTRRTGIRIIAPEQRVQVLDIPAAYPANEPWLPATNVQLRETWTPDYPQLELGEPVARSISVTALGNTGSSIPPLQIAFPDAELKSYPEAPVLDDDTSTGGVIGSRIESYSLVPVVPGNLDLPAVSLTWWDTAGQQVRTARLPGRRLVLVGVPETPSPAAAGAAAPATGDPQSSTTGSAVTPAAASNEPVPTRWVLGWLALAVGAATIWWFRGRLMRPRQRSQRPARGQPRHAARSLKAACSRNDLPAVRRELLATLVETYDQPRAAALAAFCAEPSRAALWQELNAALYGPDKTTRADLARQVWRTARKLQAPSATSTDRGLPPLYPA